MTNTAGRFHDRTYLVVGGSSGIGLATAKLLADEGARLVLIGRKADKLRTAVASLAGLSHESRELDACDETAVRTFMSDLRDRGTRLDGAVFCAGTHSVRPARYSRQSHYLEAIASNLFSVTNFVPGLVPLATPDASIVLVSSAAITRGAAAISSYAAAKSALVGLSRSLAAELATKIRVNTILPGVVQTPMTDGFFSTIGGAAVDEVRRRHPLGVGNAEDVAGPICFLLSQDARWITGAELAVDGGFAIAG